MAMEEDHGKIISREKKKEEEEEEAMVRPTRSFRYEDYSTRRVFLRSYPLRWDWSSEPADEKRGLADPDAAPYDGSEDDDDDRCGTAKGWWRRQVVVAVVEWGEGKLVLLRRAKKRLTLYLLGCHRGRPALPFRSGGGSPTKAMLGASR